MKIDIPYYIRQVLREQRKVYLPEIGTFILSQSPAHISDDKSRIHPPVLNVEFNDGRSDDKSLKRYIQDTNKYSDKKIDSSISKYTQSSFDNLINDNVNKIDGLGSLRRNAELDKVTFEPTLDLFTKEYKNLRPLSINPIDRIKENSVVNHIVDTQDQVVRAESKYRWLQTILAGILIAALAIVIKTCSESDAMLYNNPDETTETLDESNTNVVVDTFFDEKRSNSKGELDAKYKEVDEMLDGKEPSGNSETKLKEELKQLVDTPELTKAIKSDVMAKDIEKVKVKKVVEETPEAKLPIKPKNKYANIIPQSGKCVIILGSFKKASNITRMISLIERNGKKVYTSQHNNKTRVGFSFDCSDVNLDNYLTDIRKRLSSKAWYLDPTIEIPYK